MTSIKDKIKTREELAKIIEKLKKEGKKVGFTNGAFDIVHAGHVAYLEDASKICDVLVVSVNTDDSVKQYKDDGRPINKLEDRQKVIAALGSVGYVTAHPERRMATTIEILKPNLYIKGGDYSPKTMTSTPVIEKLGGKSVVLKLVQGVSTTDVIKKICETYASTYHFELPSKEKAKAVFLDRDGVINKEVEYLHEPGKFEFEKNAIDGVKKMYNKGYKIVVITTQAGIGLGYFTKEDFYKVNKVMLKGLGGAGINVDRVYFCPHSKADNCNCRKPKTALFERAKKDLNLDFKESYMIGDMTRDIEAGKNIGAKTILVKTGHAGKDGQSDVKPDFVVDDLVEAAKVMK